MVVENLTQRSDELLEVGENLNAIRNYLIASSTVETARDKFHKGKRYQVGIKEIYSWLNKNGEVMSIGKRILEEEGKPEYGEGTIEEIAKDLGMSRTDLFRCIQFAKKSHDVGQFIDKSWRWITQNYLPTQKRE